MVGRRSDAPRSLPARTVEQGKRLDGLRQEIGRGAGALRAEDLRVLLTNSGGQPLLVPVDDDSNPLGGAFKFTPSGLAIRDPTDSVDYDLTAGNVGASGNVSAGGNVAASGSVAAGNSGISSLGPAAVFGRITGYGGVETTTSMWAPSGFLVSNSSTSASSYHTASICAAPNFYGAFHGTLDASERRLKDEREPITDGLEIVRRLRPARWTWKDGSRDTAIGDWPRVHAGLYVDEHPPEAVIEQKKPDPLLGVPVPNGEITYDRDATIAYLVSAVQTLAEQLDQAKARLANLTERAAGG